jgi:hypothetical protein
MYNENIYEKFNHMPTNTYKHQQTTWQLITFNSNTRKKIANLFGQGYSPID